MFDLGWTELLVIGIVALIVIGPKDLPVLFQQVGRFVGRAKGMAREFSSAMNQAANESGLKETQNTLKSATDAFKTMQNPARTAMKSVKEATDSVTKLNLDPESETGKLAAERDEAARKIREATAKREEAKREAAAAAEAAKAETPAETAPAETPKDTE